MVSRNSPLTTTKTSSLQEWDAWHARRLSSVTSPTGNLALIETRWSPPEMTLEEALVGQPSTVIATKQTRTDFDGNVIAKGVRLWDSNSEAIQSFETIDTYPFDPSWVFEASFIPHPESRAVPFEYVREAPGLRNLAVPGEIKVSIEGIEYHLDAFDDEGTLLLVFADPTNGKETYPAGRFLVLPKEENSDRVIIDFNRAYVPPCGFSIAYNCPLPPPQNPIFRNNYEIH
jgi:uncharacterized protein (DUF1684 family)